MGMSYQEIIDRSLAMKRKNIPEHEAYQICNDFDIPYAPAQFARNRNEVSAAGKKLGFPLVLKIVSPEIVHKSDVGGVITGISAPGDLETAYEKMMTGIREKKGDMRIDGVLIQKMMPTGVEVVIGGQKNELFGPVVMFGSGGILIEIFKDVSFRLAPLDADEALRQIQDTKAYEILKGVRGSRPCDLNAITRLIVNASNLISKIPEIDEVDFNPVLAYPDKCVIVDARMILKG
jgi:acetate---CoA ligase (ADP-forming) subunit beta